MINSLHELEMFFQNYAAASLGLDPTVIAAFYAERFVAGAPNGSAVFNNDGQFLQWLEGVQEFNKRTGMKSLGLFALEEPIVLSEHHVLAKVEWGARFKKGGGQLIRFKVAYLLEKKEGHWKVLAYISEKDQESEMRRLGIL